MDTIALGHAFYAALDGQDWPRVESLAHPDIVVQVGSAPPMTFEKWREALAPIYAGFPDGRHVIDEYLVDGDRFVTVCRFEGTHTGPFAGTAPTGRGVSVRVIHVDRFHDGRLVAHRGQLDMLGLLRQIGAVSV